MAVDRIKEIAPSGEVEQICPSPVGPDSKVVLPRRVLQIYLPVIPTLDAQLLSICHPDLG